MNIQKEKPGLLWSGRKPADIYAFNYLNGSDYAFDVTVVSPYKKNKIARTMQHTGISAEDAILSKYKKYQMDIEGVNWKFQPIAFERTGGWSLPSQLLLKRIARLTSSKFNIQFQIVLKGMVTEISSILLKQTANMIIRRKTDIGPDYFDD